jgi:hypothetical protein
MTACFSIAQLEEGETCPEHVKLGIPWGEDSFAIHMIFPAGILESRSRTPFSELAMWKLLSNS